MADAWEKAAKHILKAELTRKGISYDQLAGRLDQMGVKETKASIESKMSRGSFRAAFMIQCLVAIGCERLPIPKYQELENQSEGV